jgi:hypothetical protein
VIVPGEIAPFRGKPPDAQLRGAVPPHGHGSESREFVMPSRGFINPAGCYRTLSDPCVFGTILNKMDYYASAYRVADGRAAPK